MKCLITEDSFITRKLMNTYLSQYFDCDIAVNGREAVEAFQQALDDGEPYELICMDINMPEMNGQEALHLIRDLEKQYRISGLDVCKVIMTTAEDDPKNIMKAFNVGCESYLVKPVTKNRLLEEIDKLGLKLTEQV